jgi:hypothetical protein
LTLVHERPSYVRVRVGMGRSITVRG